MAQAPAAPGRGWPPTGAGSKDTLSPYRETVKAALVHLDATDQSERVVDAIRATAADTEDDIADMEEDEAMTRRALELLGLAAERRL